MENLPPNQPQPSPLNVAKPAAAQPPQTSAAQPQQTGAVQPASPSGPKPTTPLPKDQSKGNKRFVIGCISAFGCSLLLFIGVLFAFLAFGSPDNPIFGFLGVPSGEVVNVLITLVNLIFLVLVFVSFIFVVIGIFRITTAKKDDKDAKRRGAIFTFGSLALMVFLIFIWIFAYFFLAQKRTITPRLAIATEPAKTTGLTAPVTIKFDASKTPINKRQFDILTYRWNFGDGAEVIGNPQAHTFTKVGNYDVKVIITLKEKATGKEQNIEFGTDVTITNILADVVIKSDKTRGEAPLKIELDGSESKSENGEIIAYAWDLNGDSSYDDAKDAKTTATFDKVGKYTIGLRVTDSTGAFAAGTIEIEVTPSDAPVAVIAVKGVESDQLESNKAYLFSGASSVSPSGTIEKYSWNFGDSGKAVTRTATHIFKEPGEYEVTLTLTDSKNKQGSAAKRFIVNSPKAPPLAGIKTTPEASNGVVTGQAPFSVIFDASSSRDPNNNIIDYSWDFDGDSKTDDANLLTSHTFSSPGTYNVSLVVSDATDLSSKSQIVVKVEPGALKAEVTAEPVAGVIPLTVAFDASGSSDPDGKIVNYEWNFGDSGKPHLDTTKVSHQYTAVGTFTAKVTVINAENKRATSQVLINVRPVSLRACFEASSETGNAPLEVEFNPTCSTGTVIKYNWNFSNLGRSTDRKPLFTFQNPGEYTITLEVTDSENTVDSFTKKILVKTP